MTEANVANVWFGSCQSFLKREEEVEDMPIDLNKRMKREAADCSLCIGRIEAPEG